MHRLIAIAAVVVPYLAPVPAVAISGGGQAQSSSGGSVSTVTLITGDRVRVQGDQALSVSMDPARKGVRYWQYRADGHDYVVPLDAAPLLAAGRLDERLFDVTGLVKQELDDQHVRDLPVIVERANRARPSTVGIPAGARVTSDLAGGGLQSWAVSKRHAAGFWSDMRALATQRRAASVDKIWLDAQVRASLDESVPMTGAPAAWRVGLRGKGVRVAVLDTGIDAAHPDIAGKIDASANFSTDSDFGDRNGHGTHVASTIVGSGAASGGRYVGMAPEARLLVGKVLNRTGTGAESGIIAGMQWAVGQGAQVVNMSLGGRPTDGTDLMSKVLNELSQSSGALFVVAAGNAGADGSVASPAAADRALAVASVTKSGDLSRFSSRGPRIGDYGFKPEIAAPGSDIVAARASGTLAAESVNPNYATLSGTSMAAPHVAGAAAILASQHPQWKADRIKSVLMETANPLPGVNAFAQGSGLLDISRAVRQQGVLSEPAAIALGELSTEAAMHSILTYRNEGDRPLTLRLSIDVRLRDGRSARTGLFELTTRHLVVPARGSAVVALKVTPRAGEVGQFVGAIHARGGRIRLTTPVVAELAGNRHRLTVSLIDRQGDAAVANVVVQNEESGSIARGIIEGGMFEALVPAGRYRIFGQILDGGFQVDSATTFALPVTQVDSDTEVIADGRKSKPVTVSVDQATARPDPLASRTGVVSAVDGPSGRSAAAVLLGGGPVTRLYSVGSPPIVGLSFIHVSQWQQPWVTVKVTGSRGYELTDALEQSPEGWRGSVAGRVVDLGAASGDIGDLHGKIPLIATSDAPTDEAMAERVKKLRDRGARLVLSFNYVADLSIIPVVQLYDPSEISELRRRLAAGPVEVRVDGRRDSSYSYFNAATVDGRVPDGYAFRFKRKEMGQLDTTFASTRPTDYFNRLTVVMDSPAITVGFDVNTRLPQKRADYYSPGFRWQQIASIGFDEERFAFTGQEITSPIELEAGEHQRMCLYCGPFGPELSLAELDPQSGGPLPWAYRHGNQLTFAVPMFGDSDPDTFAPPDSTDVGATVLTSSNGLQLGHNNVPGRGRFAIAPGTGRYRLTTEASRSAPEWPTSVRTRAEWTFTSLAVRPGQRAVLPLLDVRFNLSLDVRNAAPTASPVTGTVDVHYQKGVRPQPIRDLAVQASYDDGAAWQTVTVTRVGNDWNIKIPAAKYPGGFVSLRARARDHLGNAVTETVTRAYALK